MAMIPRGKMAGLQGLALTQAVPHDHPPRRLPTFPNLERTSVLQFTQQTTVNTLGGTSSDAGRCGLLLFRSPIYPLWGTTSWTLQASTPVYSVVGTTSSGAANTFRLPDKEGEAWSFGSTHFYMGNGSFALNSVPPPIGCADNKAYMYWPRGVSLTVRLSLGALMGPIYGGLTCTAYTWVPANFNESGGGLTATWDYPSSETTAKQSIDFVFPALSLDRWVRLDTITCFGDINWSSGSNHVITGISVNYSADTYPSLPFSYWPLFFPAEADKCSLPYDDTRCTAAAVLISNVTKVLNKEGTISARRLAVRNAYPWDLGAAVLPTHPKERYFGPLEKGMYAFTIGDASSERFADSTLDTGNMTTRSPIFPLDCFDYFESILMTDPAPSDISTFAITLDHHIEFRSQSMLFPLAYSQLSLEEHHSATMALLQLGPFYENPLHLSDIANLVRKAVSIVAPHVKPVAIASAKMLAERVLPGSSKMIPIAMNQAGLVVRAARKIAATRKPKAKKAKGRGKK